MRQARLLLVLVLLTVPCVLAAPLRAEEPVNLDAMNRIRDEGLHHSHVMEIARDLTTRIGARLTGSPAMKRANEWTRDQLAGWGLANAHLEPWGPFGRGWSFSRASVTELEPFQMPLIALPKAWTPGTDGPVRGPAMRVTIESEDDLAQYRGKLAGKILLLDDARELRSWDDPVVQREDAEHLAALETLEIPGARRGDWRDRARKRWELRRKMNELFASEGALATLEPSFRDAGILSVSGGGSREAGESPGVPALVVQAEQYNRLVRILEAAHDEAETTSAAAGEAADGMAGASRPAGEPAVEEVTAVEVAPLLIEVDVAARFYDDDPMAYDTIAEIPGTDLADQVVMAGAHLDSWHTGTGATDNAAGCAMVMEAVRILEALGVQPRRTIRVGLWSGEEQGLLGSQAYVAHHFASRPEPEDPEQKALPSYLRTERGPLTVKPEHADLAAYFNLDNGGGRIRGIYTQENAAVVPIFQAWLAPFHDLGATTVSTQDTGGTDHLSFDRVGLPGFQFIQDMRDYFALTHHTAADTFDHLNRDDMVQASVVMAAFLYDAAMRDEPLPRKPLPRDE